MEAEFHGCNHQPLTTSSSAAAVGAAVPPPPIDDLCGALHLIELVPLGIS